MSIVAWQYEADYHCWECAERKFGDFFDQDEDVRDGEGNPVHPLLDGEEYELPLVCGTCGNVIEEE